MKHERVVLHFSAASDDEDVRIIDMDVESDTGGDVCIESSAPGTSAHRTGSDPVATVFSLDFIYLFAMCISTLESVMTE